MYRSLQYFIEEDLKKPPNQPLSTLETFVSFVWDFFSGKELPEMA